MLDLRQSEILILNEIFNSLKCSVVAVTGQKGMGKSTLIRHFVSDKEAYYYDALETTGKHQLEIMASFFGIKNPKNINSVLDKITAAAANGPVAFVIDSYPNFYKSDAAFNEALIKYVSENWSELPVTLILIGDEFVLMDKNVLSKKSKWKDIKIDNICLKKLGFYDSRKFFENLNVEQAAYLYGITGGISYNLARVATDANEVDLKEVTTKLFLAKDTATGLNPMDVMSTELRELSYYNHLLVSLASGLNRVNQISAEVDKPKDVVVPYLNSLMAIDICTKDTAITELNNRKKTRYSIVNTSTFFWYKFIATNYGAYCAGDSDCLWNAIEAGFSDFMQRVFIEICSEYLMKSAKEDKLPFTVDAIGNWWVNDDEAGTTDGFDLVALGDYQSKDATVFAQCYYIDKPVELTQLKSLIDKTKQMSRKGDAFYLVFSKKGFHENAITASSAIPNIMLITLDDME